MSAEMSQNKDENKSDCREGQHHSAVGADRLPQLVETLSKMNQASDRSVNAYIDHRNFSSIITDAELNWLNTAIQIFKHVYDTLCPDASAIDRQVCIIRGDFSQVNRLNEEAKNLFHLRFQTILDRLTVFEVKRSERIYIATNNYELGLMVNLARFNSLKSFKDQIQHYMGNAQPVTGLDGIPPANCIDHIFVPGKLVDQSLAQNLNAILKRLSFYVQREDLYILFMISVLLDETSGSRISHLCNVIRKLMAHRLASYNEFDQFKDSQTCMSNFYSDLQVAKRLMRSYVASMM